MSTAAELNVGPPISPSARVRVDPPPYRSSDREEAGRRLVARELAVDADPVAGDRRRLDEVLAAIRTLECREPGDLLVWLGQARRAHSYAALLEARLGWIQAGGKGEFRSPGRSPAVAAGVIASYVRSIGPSAVERLLQLCAVRIGQLDHERTDAENSARLALLSLSSARSLDPLLRAEAAAGEALARLDDVTSRAESIRAAVARFQGGTFAEACARAIEAAGGVERVARALRIVRYGAAEPDISRDPEVMELSRELAAVDSHVSALGRTVARGMTAEEAADAEGSLAAIRERSAADLRGRIEARAATIRLEHRSLRPEVERVAAGDLGAWKALLAVSQVRPDLFAEGFAANLLDAAGEAFAAAGAEAFAGSI